MLCAGCQKYVTVLEQSFRLRLTRLSQHVSRRKYCFDGGLQFTIGGSQISVVNDYVHLGHHISANLDDKSDTLSSIRSLCGKINNVLCQFSNCDPIVKLRLLRNFCCDFYGSTLWDLANSSIQDLCIAWRKGL